MKRINCYPLIVEVVLLLLVLWPNIIWSDQLLSSPTTTVEDIINTFDVPNVLPSSAKGSVTVKIDDFIRSNAPGIVERILFDSGSCRIEPESFPSIRNYVTAMNSPKLKGAIFLIAGYADSKGNPRNNLKLSKQRAQAVKNFLVFAKVPEDRLIVKGYGAAYPLDSNETAQGRAKNRRVEFIRLDVLSGIISIDALRRDWNKP